MYRKLIFALIIFIIAVSSAGAAEMNSSDRVASDGADVVSGIENNNQIYADAGTFDDLSSEVNATPEMGVLTLTRDYRCVNGSTDGIKITKPMTIDGNGHTIDGSRESRIFHVEADHVTIKNVNFINGQYYHSGGAIYWDGNEGVVSGCSFTDNVGYLYDGGAVCWNGYDGVISACTFTGNTAGQIGGAVYWKGSGAVYDSVFENNTALYGGAMWSGCAVNCTFTNNYASYDGGAMDGADAKNCRFYKNQANNNGGAMDGSYTADNCIFIENHASCGGAIYGFEANALNCNFTSNWASSHGGAMYQGNALNCRFDSNRASSSGGAMAGSSAENCIFTGNSANEGGAVFSGNSFKNCVFTSNHAQDGGATYMCSQINCTFKDNLATRNGGAIYEGEMQRCTFKNNVAGASGSDAYEVQIIRLDTKISASPVTTVYNGGKYLLITLKDDYGAVSGVTLTVNVAGRTYTPKTNSKGQVRISTNALVPVKSYVAKITFAGNVYFEKASKSVKVTVKKATPKVIASSKSFKASAKTKRYTVTLKTNQNKVLKNAKMILKVAGKTYSAKTNAKGQATFNIINLKKKCSVNAIVRFAGNSCYNAKSVNAKIIVK